MRGGRVRRRASTGGISEVYVLALMWNAGFNTQDMARVQYGIGAPEAMVYNVLDLIKREARRMRRAAAPFDREPIAPTSGHPSSVP